MIMDGRMCFLPVFILSDIVIVQIIQVMYGD